MNRERLYGIGLLIAGLVIFCLFMNLSTEQRNLWQEQTANRINRDRISEQARQIAQMRQGFVAEKKVREAIEKRHQYDTLAIKSLDAERRALFTMVAQTSARPVPKALLLPGFNGKE